MTGKQRITATIARQDVDHVPLGLYAVDYDIVSKVLGWPTYVRDKIAAKVLVWQGRRDELAESYKKDTVEFYRKIDCADIILPKEAERPDPSCFEAIDYLIDQLGEDRYVCSKVEITALTCLGDTATGLMMYALQPDVVHAANRRQTDQQNQLDQYNIRPGSAGVFVEQDMAGTNGPLVSPQMFRDMCLPYLAERVANIKRHAGQVGLHNCGNNMPLMEMFIEAGIDYYQSLQTTAGMEIGKLKGMYGNRMCFWGGVALEVLIRGTPADVRREVRTAVQRGAPGGGFILGPSHSIAKGTGYENFMAMIDEYVKLRDKY